ncbi:MAG TPA: type II secretion system protein [Abditibacteriaceae bacterium]|jgi:general secretion pathway protein G
MNTSRRAFTLVEILIVLAVIGILAAIILPAFASVRGKARQTSCASNLRQLGMAMTQYTADYDQYPRGLDPADQQTPDIWVGQKAAEGVDFGEIKLLPDVLNPYVKTRQIWRCAADSGFDVQEITGTAMDARPTCFDKYGMSYFYRTELTLLNLAEERLPHPAETNVLSDGDGTWHGSKLWEGRRYNILYADGHVKNVGVDAFYAAWNTPVREGVAP